MKASLTTSSGGSPRPRTRWRADGPKWSQMFKLTVVDHLRPCEHYCTMWRTTIAPFESLGKKFRKTYPSNKSQPGGGRLGRGREGVEQLGQVDGGSEPHDGRLERKGVFRSARTSYRAFDFRPVRPPVRANFSWVHRWAETLPSGLRDPSNRIFSESPWCQLSKFGQKFKYRDKYKYKYKYRDKYKDRDK